MDLNNAEVQVTTSLLLHAGVQEVHLLRLADYGEMDEFHIACAERFPKENNPTYQYQSWENIPSFLINHHWICPNIFEIRDAMEHLDESEYDYFVEWCCYHGHNLATDDANLLVAHFQDMYGSGTENEEPSELPDEALLYQSIIGNHFDYSHLASDILTTTTTKIMQIDFNKHIWEGWTVRDFIKELHLPIGIIMLGKAIRPPFVDKTDLAQWCQSHQPYYKPPISEVNEYFSKMYGL